MLSHPSENFLPLGTADIVTDGPDTVRMALLGRKSEGKTYDHGVMVETYGVLQKFSKMPAVEFDFSGRPHIHIISIRHAEKEEENFGTISELRIEEDKRGRPQISSFETSIFRRRQPVGLTAHAHEGLWNATSLAHINERITGSGQPTHLPVIKEALQRGIEHYEQKKQLVDYEPHGLRVLKISLWMLEQVSSK